MGEPATSEGCAEVPGGRVWYQITGADRPATAIGGVGTATQNLLAAVSTDCPSASPSPSG